MWPNLRAHADQTANKPTNVRLSVEPSSGTACQDISLVRGINPHDESSDRRVNEGADARADGRAALSVVMWTWLVLHSLTMLQPTTVRRTLRFPRDSLIGVNGDEPLRRDIVPGACFDSSPFEAGGSSWQVSLYPCGQSSSDAGRVGVYLKLNGAPGREVDASFSLALQVLPVDTTAAAVPPEGAASRGLDFRCGMTFCDAAQALESAGRCEDWGAHVYNSALLFSELESTAESTAGVDVELQVWGERACGSASEAFLEQTKRLPRGAVRVGEVIVALAGSPARVDDGTYRCVPGVEYRVMRLVAPDGTARFELDNSADRSSLVYLLPTSKAARGEDDAEDSKDGVASVLLDDDTTGSSLPGARFLRRKSRAETWGDTTQDWQGVTSKKWPVGVPVDALPPLASRLGFRSFPARFAYAARTSGSVLLLLVVIGASPLWGGYLVTRLGSGYVIPSRSMESTLNVGDVVLAEKISRIARLPLQSGDLVLFNPPSKLQQLVGEAGGKLGSRDLFVKRVAAVGGDTVELQRGGSVTVNGVPRTPPPRQCEDSAPPSVFPGEAEAGAGVTRTIPEGSIFVLGDCPSRSTDSRSWGPLPVENVVARPVVRVWPLGRQGAID